MCGIVELQTDDLSDAEREVANKVATHLKVHLLADEGWRVEEVQYLRQIRRAFSTIFIMEARAAAESRRFVAKKIVHPPINRAVTQRSNQAMVEFGVLSNLWKAFERIPDLTVPKPILILPEHEAYVMEYVEGDMLVNCFRCVRHLQPRRSFHRLVRHYHQVGEWLRYFQSFTRFGYKGREGVAEVLERCSLVIDRISKQKDGRIPPDFAPRIMARLEQLGALIAPDEVPCCGWNHDFGPWNMIVDKERLAVIDFLGYSIGPVAMDPIKVLISLHDESLYFTNSKHRILKLRESFLAGYAPVAEVPSEVALLCEALCRLSSVIACLEAKNERLDRRIARRLIMKKHVRWLYDGAISDSIWPQSKEAGAAAIIKSA